MNSITPHRKKHALADFLEYQSKNRSDPVVEKRNVSPVQVLFIGRSEVLISEFHAAVESRRDGLHPMLRALLAQAGQAAEITRRADGMLQAGPSPASEASLQESDAIPSRRLAQALKDELRGSTKRQKPCQEG